MKKYLLIGCVLAFGANQEMSARFQSGKIWDVPGMLAKSLVESYPKETALAGVVLLGGAAAVAAYKYFYPTKPVPKNEEQMKAEVMAKLSPDQQQDAVEVAAILQAEEAASK